MAHTTVLLHEAIEGLNINAGDIFIDCTLGGGGHTEEVRKKFGDAVKIIGFDADFEAVNRAKERLEGKGYTATFIVANFRTLDVVLGDFGITKVQRVLFDLGWNADQFDAPATTNDSSQEHIDVVGTGGRGFSFQKDEPLLMSYKKNPGEEDLTAKVIVNEWSEDSIRQIIISYGEEWFAKSIARAIVEARKSKSIETTGDLLQIIKSATPGWYHHRKIHFATKTFQALRITVNDELGALKEGITKAFEALSPNGRMAIISFHSLEDRIVKNFIKEKVELGLATAITKKPIIPSSEELHLNRRARSAKLRIVEKIKELK